MKRLVLVSLAAAALLASCTKPEDKQTDNSVKVKLVSLNKSTLTLTEGDSFALSATILPEDADDQAVSWSSSDEAVASVSNEGLVLAKKEGKATVTVTTHDGGKTSSCAVTVEAQLDPSVTIGANHISCISAVLSGKANLGKTTAADLKMGIMYSKSSGVLPSTSTMIEATDIEAEYYYSIQLTDLEPETTYYYRSYVYQGGENTYGDTKSFTTKPISSLVSTKSISVTGDSATLKGLLNLTDYYEEEVEVEDGFYMGTDENNLDKLLISDEEEFEEGLDGFYFIYNLTNLHPSTTYYLRPFVKLNNKEFIGDLQCFSTNSVEVILSEVSVAEVEECYSLSGNYAATVIGRFETIPEDFSYGINAFVYYKDDNSSSFISQAMTISERGMATTRLHSLMANTKYDYYIVLKCADQEVNSHTYSFLTGSGDNTLSFDAAGDSKTLTFSSTQDWTAYKTESWITLSKISGSGSNEDQKITITVSSNENGYARSGYVKISSMFGVISIPVTQAGGKTITYTSIADLRAMAGDVNTLATTGKVIEGEVFIKGLVVSDPRIQSLNSNKTFYVMDETAGIQVICAVNAYNHSDEENSLLFGHEVQLEVSGALLYPYGQALELVSGLNGTSTVGFDNTKIKVLSKDNEVTPKSVTMADFMDNKYEGSYVKITDKKVQVDESDLSKKWYNASSGVSNVNLQTEDNETIVVRVAQYASYKDEQVPQGSGYLQGIAGYYNGTIQVTFAETGSYKTWTSPRFDITYTDKSIADIYADNKLTNISIDAVVVATADRSIAVNDGTGTIYVYIGAAHTWKIADKVHVEGFRAKYGTGNPQLIQVSDPTITVSEKNVIAAAAGSPKVISASEFLTYASAKAEYIQIEGTLSVSGNYYNLTVDGVDAASCQGTLIAGDVAKSASVGEPVVVKGYFAGRSESISGVKYIYILPTEIGQSSTPNFDVIEAEKGISVSAKATSATINVRGNVAWTVSSDNSAFVVTPSSGEGAAQITVEFGENSSTIDARVANITVSTTADVKSNRYVVNILQTAYVKGWNRVTNETDILSGGTFIIGYEETANSGVIVPMRADNCGAKTTANGIIITGTNATSSTSDKGTIDMATYSGTGTYEITITASTLSGAVNLQLIDGSYIGCPGAKNTARLYTEASESNTAYTVTAKDNDTFQLTCEAQKSTTYYFLQYNTSSPRFCNYTGSQKNPVFYKYF